MGGWMRDDLIEKDVGRRNGTARRGGRLRPPAPWRGVPEAGDLPHGPHAQKETKKVIIEGISDALMMLDAWDYRILDVNRAFLETYKISRDRVLGRTCYEITHHLGKPCSRYADHKPCPLEESVASGKPVTVEHQHKDGTGGPLYVEVTAYPLKDATGKVTQLVHLARDVSDRRKREEALNKRLEEAEPLAAIGQRVAEITHEIKKPLMLIGGFAQQLSRRSSDEEKKFEKLNIIIHQVNRLERLLTDLRELYAPKARADEEIDVEKLLRGVHALVKDECEKRNIRTDMVLKGNGFRVRGNPDGLEQVFLNVLMNSIEAMEAGGNLKIRVASSGGDVEITIDDEGCGISKEHMNRIHECFFTTKRFGTGLGLCLSKRIIDGYKGGAFIVESEEGKGTSVRIKLPAST